MNGTVLVKWHDGKFSPGTFTKEEISRLKMAQFESIGYLMSRDTTTTVIAAECNDEGQYRNITLIPSGSILSVQELVASSSV